MAVAFTLTIGVLNFLNFTIPALFMVTGMSAWALTHYGLPFGLSGPLPWVAALAGGIVAAMVLSLLVERFSYRYLKARHGDSTEHAIPLVSSLGFLLIIENLVRIQFGTDTHSFSTPLARPQRVDRWRADQPAAGGEPGAVAGAGVRANACSCSKSKTGRAIRAIAENPDAAMVVGIDVRRIVPVVFLATGLLCGIAASIYAANYGEDLALDGRTISAARPWQGWCWAAWARSGAPSPAGLMVGLDRGLLHPAVRVGCDPGQRLGAVAAGAADPATGPVRPSSHRQGQALR